MNKNPGRYGNSEPHSGPWLTKTDGYKNSRKNSMRTHGDMNFTRENKQNFSQKRKRIEHLLTKHRINVPIWTQKMSVMSDTVYIKVKNEADTYQSNGTSQ